MTQFVGCHRLREPARPREKWCTIRLVVIERNFERGTLPRRQLRERAGLPGDPWLGCRRARVRRSRCPDRVQQRDDEDKADCQTTHRVAPLHDDETITGHVIRARLPRRSPQKHSVSTWARCSPHGDERQLLSILSAQCTKFYGWITALINPGGFSWR